MKHVMIAIFTVCMGYSAYIFGNLTTKQLTDEQTHTNWIWFALLILVSILSIGYACVLGRREDKKQHRKIEIDIENLEREKQNREGPPRAF